MRDEISPSVPPEDDLLDATLETDDPDTWPADEPALDPEVDPADFADQHTDVELDAPDIDRTE